MCSDWGKRPTDGQKPAQQVIADFEAIAAILERAMTSYDGNTTDAEYLGLERARIVALRGVELAGGLADQSER